MQCILKGWKTCRKAIRWVVHKRDKVSFINDSWITDHPPIRSIIEGPLTQIDFSVKVATIYNTGAWDASSISLSILPNIRDLLSTTFIPSNPINEDKMIWGNTSNGLFNIKSAYNLIANIAPRKVEEDNNSYMRIWNWRSLTRSKPLYGSYTMEGFLHGLIFTKLGFIVTQCIVSVLTLETSA